MRFYRVTAPDCRVWWSVDRTAAHRKAKEYLKQGADRFELRVELNDVPITHGLVEELLNGGDPEVFATLRVWELTPRGGLREIQPGE